MKKILLINALVCFSVGIVFAQTTATDFTTNDCNGVSHNLFSELDAGNVIVISWVMPCFGCIAPSLEAYYAVQSFATSHPGRVHFYIASDDGLDPCSSFINWGSNNNMPLNTTFNSVDTIPNMYDYGAPGMPKVVVLGGASHLIYYNENNAQPTFNGVQTAITNALTLISWDCDGQGNCSDPGTGTGQFGALAFCQSNCAVTPTWDCTQNACVDPETGNGIYSSVAACQTACGATSSWNYDGQGNEFEILSYPNPVNNVLNVSYSNIKFDIINFTIVDVLGKVVLKVEENSSSSTEKLIKSINVSTLNNGNYFLKISSGIVVESIPFVVSH
jgi:hypothetical protein